MNNQRRNEKGFTMIELIIVVAIMGILAAILVPSFAGMSRKSRLKSDIRTVQTLQKQVDLYYAENGRYPGLKVGESLSEGDELGEICSNDLCDAEMVEAKYFEGGAGGAVLLQSSGCSATWDAGKLHFVVSGAVGNDDEKIDKIAQNIIDSGTEDADWLAGE